MKLTYTVENVWDRPRGVGYNVWVRDENGKSVTGNKAAFHSSSTSDKEAQGWVKNHKKENKGQKFKSMYWG